MPRRFVKVLHADGETLRNGIAVIQRELEVTAEFPDEVERAAQQAAGQPRLPELDRTDIPLVTIDPATSMDLDQALHIERDGTGYVVHYAISDVAAFVSPGDRGLLLLALAADQAPTCPPPSGAAGMSVEFEQRAVGLAVDHASRAEVHPDVMHGHVPAQREHGIVGSGPDGR